MYGPFGVQLSFTAMDSGIQDLLNTCVLMWLANLHWLRKANYYTLYSVHKRWFLTKAAHITQFSLWILLSFANALCFCIFRHKILTWA